MRKLPECRRCKFYADNELLVCALHPDGIAHGNDTCSDFEITKQRRLKEHNYRAEDLDFASALIRNQGCTDEQFYYHGLSEMMATMLYNPTRDLLEQPLSDFFYYVLRLSQLLADLTRYTPLQLPDERYGQLRADERSIMVHQARFLIAHGWAEVLTPQERQFLYGEDFYIARRITNYLSRESDLTRAVGQPYFDDMLERISSNANLHGIEAVERLFGSNLLFGFKYPPDFDLNKWKGIGADNQTDLVVPFSVPRTIAFIKQRFNIVLNYPF
ncbi:hypothetical protein [Aliterella atlantica]|uniref:Uncharacterized protein n=1 Tax=Aliterella atlantica CENA595 TaxID=1618023 RepID=A0A0D8ZML4_9CYAN|nr:hypothetical protein [Aliterella atlantica]KJH69592.1 hypothetical protein UH38_22920 [Aliterella atlantica CENA595]